MFSLNTTPTFTAIITSIPMMKQTLILFIGCWMALSTAVAQTPSSPTALARTSTDSLLFDPLLAPFYHGVASGDPLQDRVIIWTRVTPEGEETSIEVEWTVATDTALENVVASGMYTTDANRDYTVKVDVEGLVPGTTYFYGFNAMDRSSLTGRTRTATTGSQDHLKFAVVSCNNYEHGFFNAFARIGERNDLDGVIHLGDYIYEQESGAYGDSALIASGQRATDTLETISLEEYRGRYSLYRLDKDLRRAHQQHPFLCIWDDHETANDSWVGGAENHTDSTEGSWNVRKSVAKQAYFEWIPIRDNADTTIYRTFSYGELLDIIMLDTRIEGRDEQILNIADPALYDPNRTLLGDMQRDWFLNALDNSTAKWKIIGNQVIFSELHVGWAAVPPQTVIEVESIFLDIWDGYPAERLKIIEHIDTSNIDNVVFLTGDFHSTFAFDVADTVSNPEAFYAPVPNYDPETGEGSVAVEFATPSITSANFDENLGETFASVIEFQFNKPLPPPAAEGSIPNPHMKYVDLDRHGYFVLDIRPDSTQANWYFVDRIDTVSSVQEFGMAAYTLSGENHLNVTETPSMPKEVQETPAPLLPPGTSTSLDAPTELTLFQIGPNPFHETCWIQYGLNRSQAIQIALYDLQGREVSRLYEGKQRPGVYQLAIEGSGLATGTYVLRFQVGHQVTSRKLVLGK